MGVTNAGFRKSTDATYADAMQQVLNSFSTCEVTEPTAESDAVRGSSDTAASNSDIGSQIDTDAFAVLAQLLVGEQTVVPMAQTENIAKTCNNTQQRHDECPPLTMQQMIDAQEASIRNK